MNAQIQQPDWSVLLTHEAGHAVAGMALYDGAADIVVTLKGAGNSSFSAAYALPDSLLDRTLPDFNPLPKIILYAAGAKAEEICLGITDSVGFVGDRAKIAQLRRQWHEKSQESYWRKLLPAHVLDNALKAIPRYQHQLGEIDAEIVSGYQQTSELIAKHRDVIRAIVEEALLTLQHIGDKGLVDRFPLLQADRVRALWMASRTSTS